MFFITLTAIVSLCMSLSVLVLALCRAASVGDRQLCEAVDDGRDDPFYPVDAGD